MMDKLRGYAGVVASAGQGLSGGFLDEIAAGALTPYDALVAKLQGQDVSMSDIYNQNLAQNRAGLKQFQTENPVAAIGSEVIGAIASPINKLKLVAGAGKLANIGKAGLTGAMQGAVFGAGNAEGNENILSGAGTGAALGGAVGGGLQAVISGAGVAGDTMKQLARGTKNKLYGLRYSDIQKSATRGAAGNADSGLSRVEQALDDLVDAKQIKAGSATDNLGAIQDQLDDIYSARSTVFNAVDSVQPDPIVPKWETTLKYIKNEVPAADRPKAMRLFEKYKNGVENESALISEFEKQKSIFQNLGKNAMGPDGQETLAANIYKNMGFDLKSAVDDELLKPVYKSKLGQEGLATVKQVRKEIADRVTLEPALQAGKSRESSTSFNDALIGMLKTTGGFGVPAIIGAQQAGPEGALAGLAAGAALRSNTGQQALIKLLQGGGAAGQALGNAQIATPAARALASLLSGNEQTQEIAPESQQSQQIVDDSFFADSEPETPISASTNKMDILLDSIRHVESRGNPKAVSNKGAMGAYQFMPATAKSYGIDPFNEDESRGAARQYIEDEMQALGDIRAAIAAYNAGRPAITRAIKKADSSNFNDYKKYLPKETQEYVTLIETQFDNRLNG
jgi:hypothetical protein